ncbi:energy-coupling factor transporter transmembrane component T family protein [Salipaludibacillus agaradhaerens]|uniref:energy-coupling factor transporter transmembrane component T family protein n=1 Tax=Salipaludibacillus agaradhaerens TaxID=76935 RepID=UPI000996C7DE|nr:energy-coupling factor transporter transmembrane component T [Salipaludibacillus agaradhaerens]
MFDNVIIGQFVPRESVIHRLDPRSKLIAVMLFVIFLFASRHPAVLISGGLLTITAFVLANIPLRFYMKGMRFIAIIILFTFILHLIMTNEGTVLWDAGWMTVYTGGVSTGALIGFRLLLLIVMTTLLTLSTTPVDLTDGMERLMQPLAKMKIPTHELALMMSIALRFIPTLLEETSKIAKAQMARGANFSQGSLWQRLKAIVPILIPLFVQAFKRAEDLATAMEARGYAGGKGRTKYRQLVWKRQDTLVISVFVLFSLMTIILQWIG